MAHPDPYARNFGFTDYSRDNPGVALPGLQVDTELNALKIFLDLLLDNIKKIQRDDGALANGIVGLDQVAPEVAFGLNGVSDWATGIQYFKLNGVWHENVLYRCLEDHISGVDFATDLAAGRWIALVDFATVLALATAAQTASETAQTAAEAAQANAENEADDAANSATAALGSENAAAASATAAATSETNAAQSETDVATAIAALIDPVANPNKLLRSDGSTFVATQTTEDSDGDVAAIRDLEVGRDLDVVGEMRADTLKSRAGIEYMKILQQGYFEQDDTVENLTTSYADMLLTPLTITPKIIGSKILFWFNAECRAFRDGTTPTVFFRLQDDTGGVTIGPEIGHQIRAAQTGSIENLINTSFSLTRQFVTTALTANDFQIQTRGSGSSDETRMRYCTILWMEIAP